MAFVRPYTKAIISRMKTGTKKSNNAPPNDLEKAQYISTDKMLTMIEVIKIAKRETSESPFLLMREFMMIRTTKGSDTHM